MYPIVKQSSLWNRTNWVLEWTGEVFFLLLIGYCTQELERLMPGTLLKVQVKVKVVQLVLIVKMAMFWCWLTLKPQDY